VSNLKSALGMILIVLIVGYVLVDNILRMLRYKAIDDRPAVTNGKIVSISHDIHSKDDTACTIEVNQATYLVRGDPAPPNPLKSYAVGDNVIVYYDANNPRCAVFETPKTAYIDQLLFVSIWGTAVISGMGYSFYRYRTLD
jgi:hypothetical protein